MKHFEIQKKFNQGKKFQNFKNLKIPFFLKFQINNNNLKKILNFNKISKFQNFFNF